MVFKLASLLIFLWCLRSHLGDARQWELWGRQLYSHRPIPLLPYLQFCQPLFWNSMWYFIWKKKKYYHFKTYNERWQTIASLNFSRSAHIVRPFLSKDFCLLPSVYLLTLQKYEDVPITMLGVGELKVKYTILILVWVLPAKTKLEKRPSFGTVTPGSRIAEESLSNKGERKPIQGCISKLMIHFWFPNRNPEC